MMENNKNDEYMMLRNEIVKRLDNQNNMSTFLITSVITLLGIGFALKNASPYFFLLPFMILLPISAQEYKVGKHISYMVGYMIVFLESTPDFPIRWESNTYLLGKLTGEEINKSITTKIVRFISNFEFTILSSVSYTLFLFYFFKNGFVCKMPNILGVCCAILFFILIIFILLITRKYNEYSTTKTFYIEKWLDYGYKQKLISEDEYKIKMKKFLGKQK